MATAWNTDLKKLVSAFFHPAAEAVDAWAVDWNRWTDVYLFPPPIAGAEGVGKHPPISGEAHSSPKRSPGVFQPQNLPRPLVKGFNLTLPPRQRVRGSW